MVVICEECGLKYQIDPSKIVGEKARFKCKGCSTSIIVEKSDSQLDDELAYIEEALLADTSSDTTEGGGEEILDFPDESEYTEEGSETDSAGTEPAAAESPAGAETSDALDDSMKRQSGLGLTAKVILLMLIVSLVPGAAYFAVSFKQISDQIIFETDKTGKTVTSLLSADVDEWIDKNVRALNAMASTPAVKSMNRFDQEIMLKALQREYPWMYLVFTTNGKGQNIARSDGNELRDYSNRQYVKDVVAGADIAWQNLIGKTSKKPALVLAVPIRNGDIIVGVLAAAMTREALSDLVTTYGEGRTGSSFLVDEKDKAVAHRQNAFVLQQQDMSKHPLVKGASRGRAQKVEFVDANGQETIGYSAKTKFGWILAIQQEKNEAFEPLKKAQMFAYYMLAGTFVVILLIAFMASRAIVKPIRSLTDAANRISVGDLDVEISTKSKDEIGDLAAAIMRMQDSIRLSIARLARRRR